MPTESPPSARFLIVDADRACAARVATLIGEGNTRVCCFLKEADRVISEGGVSLVVVDPATLGTRAEMAQWIAAVRRRDDAPAVIVLTEHGSLSEALALARLPIGISDYLVKPVVDERLRQSVEHALRQHQLLRGSESHTSSDTDPFGSLVGGDRWILQLLNLANTVAKSRATVLVTGETGTGKSMLARAIHQGSPRRENAFVEVSCGSISETLLESELFGHVKGAFTGAIADKRGRFEKADGGTIFLDEINSASPAMQVKLLRFLQEHSFEPVGSNDTRHVDVRTILATNADLESLVAHGKFREDLYYRVNVVAIRMPPLRERIDDVQMLAEHFLNRSRDEMSRSIVGFSGEAMAALQRHSWPGNVRELQNAVERAVVVCDSPTIGLGDLPESVTSVAPLSLKPSSDAEADIDIPVPLESALQDPERRIIEAALDRNGWSRIATAKELGIDRTTLYKKMRKLGVGKREAA